MHAIAMVHKMQRLALSTGSSISAIHTDQDEEGDDRIDHQSTISGATDATPAAATAAATSAAATVAVAVAAAAAAASPASAPIDKPTDKTVDMDVSLV